MGLEISESAIQSFELFGSELKKWNSKVNLTAITDDKAIAVKHILDSLFFAGFVKEGELVLDIGSGAGIPAIPLKIFKPEVSVVSVDAVAKKINFQRHICRLLKFKGFEALHSRIEDLHISHARRFDVITSRAFSKLGQFVKLAAPLLADGGRMIAMKGPTADDEISMASAVLESLGFKISAVFPYNLPFNYGERQLTIITSRESA